MRAAVFLVFQCVAPRPQITPVAEWFVPTVCQMYIDWISVPLCPWYAPNRRQLARWKDRNIPAEITNEIYDSFEEPIPVYLIFFKWESDSATGTWGSTDALESIERWEKADNGAAAMVPDSSTLPMVCGDGSTSEMQQRGRPATRVVPLWRAAPAPNLVDAALLLQPKEEPKRRGTRAKIDEIVAFLARYRPPGCAPHTSGRYHWRNTKKQTGRFRFCSIPLRSPNHPECIFFHRSCPCSRVRVEYSAKKKYETSVNRSVIHHARCLLSTEECRIIFDMLTKPWINHDITKLLGRIYFSVKPLTRVKIGSPGSLVTW